MTSGSSTIAFVVAAILAWFAFATRKPETPQPLRVAVIEALGGSNDALKQYEEQQRKERESLDEFRTTAPYREARSIAIDPAYGKILGFCSLGEGRLAAVTGQADAYGAVVDTHDPATVGNRLVWLSADGREERSVPLDFSPRAVNPGPDGSLWVVGGSNVAHFSADGEKLAAADAPHFTLSPEGREEFVEEVKTRHAAEIESYKQSMKMQEEMVAELEGKKEGDPGYQPEEMVKLYKNSCDSMKAHVESRQNMTDEQVVDEAIERVRQIHRVAVTAEHVFLVTNQDVGHGFAVWRCTTDLAEPVRIVEGLAGCCGQMDVQAVEGGLAIAENSRHQVRLARPSLPAREQDAAYDEHRAPRSSSPRQAIRNLFHPPNPAPFPVNSRRRTPSQSLSIPVQADASPPRPDCREGGHFHCHLPIASCAR